MQYLHLYSRAEDGAQTRDPQLGRLMLYQLSYFRKFFQNFARFLLRSAIEVNFIALAYRKNSAYLNIELSFVGSDGFEPPKSKDS